MAKIQGISQLDDLEDVGSALQLKATCANDQHVL